MFAKLYYTRSILFWVITVIVGSVIAGAVSHFVFDNNDRVNMMDLYQVLSTAGYSIIFSSVFSIPVILLNLISKKFFNKRVTSSWFIIMNLVHLLSSAIIFAFLIYVSQNGQFITYIKLCAFIYPVIGQVLWYLDFRMDLVVSKKVRYSLDI